MTRSLCRNRGTEPEHVHRSDRGERVDFDDGFYEFCRCGAARKNFKHPKQVGLWHVCELCVERGYEHVVREGE